MDAQLNHSDQQEKSNSYVQIFVVMQNTAYDKVKIISQMHSLELRRQIEDVKLFQRFELYQQKFQNHKSFNQLCKRDHDFQQVEYFFYVFINILLAKLHCIDMIHKLKQLNIQGQSISELIKLEIHTKGITTSIESKIKAIKISKYQVGKYQRIMSQIDAEKNEKTDQVAKRTRESAQKAHTELFQRHDKITSFLNAHGLDQYFTLW
ncbi:hypothetical protein RFI_21678 [Reticulomyxa filosa]|uniref:Uncharacterized protein n=1 Tax=Reticulomyxa filosa TaxID=46433 RepID=X6MP92_RETFI|nr:hypothetical protein RFI_21678 [Reticulomyxa filosa]|eukprot:ETO15684.1 hypothetical protein RFI_21678 [Reticulomyxa filosa]